MTPPLKVFELIFGKHKNLVVICDHASNSIPSHYCDLGLRRENLDRHIAYDIGSEGVAKNLAKIFSARLVLSKFSRLLIDPNRGADDPTLVMRISDGAVIPGNAYIDDNEIARRIKCFWEPYRSAIAAQIQDIMQMGQTPTLVSIHTFTPVFHGQQRKWTCAVLWDKDDRIARPMITALRAAGEVVGDNQPYDGALKGDTLYDSCTTLGLPHVLLEIRQDLALNEAQQAAWAQKIAAALAPILDSPEVKQQKFYGSRSG